MPSDSPRIFNIPAGLPFLEKLAAALMDGKTLAAFFGDEAGLQPTLQPILQDVTILLPTRRAKRALGEAFLRVTDGDALILPRIMQLGEDDDELLFDPPTAEMETLELQPAISSLERQFRLARLIIELEEKHAPGGMRDDICRAVRLAGELAGFLDMAETERVALGDIASLVPDEFAENWQITVEFLKLLTARWPQVLQELGLVDPAARRNSLLEMQALRWQAKPPPGPVIAAGSTGSIPATSVLLDTIARLPRGSVILPGLDVDLDKESWEFVGQSRSHPQYGMNQLLRRMDVDRAEVLLWPGCETSAEQKARSRLLSETLRPAETTGNWHLNTRLLADDAEASLHGVSLIEAPTQGTEALAIALAMREVLDMPGKTAALVTPDRNLARRVATELRRWHIEIDDSAGMPLKYAPVTNFLRLVAEMVTEDFAPVPLLACLKHPLAALGRNVSDFRQAVRRLERKALRGPRPGNGLDGTSSSLGADQPALTMLVSELREAAAPLAELCREKTADFAALLTAHVAVAEKLAAHGDMPGENVLWAGDDGEAAHDFVTQLFEAADRLGTIETRAYKQLFADLAGMATIRPRFGKHPRLFIWGPLEARLQHADRMILGGLNEGMWPAQTRIDPWLNRPMRATLGIEPPERRIGLAAHDFAMAASAPEVMLTRAQKMNGAPAVPSRWLLRLRTLLTGLAQAEAISAPQWSVWSGMLDKSPASNSIGKPRPAPPLEARPDRFSVTEVETLIRDPYAIYAKKVLRLRPLDPLDADIAAAERGTIIHKALENFAKLYPEALPENPLEELLRIGRDTFGSVIENPAVATFWWPRFERVAAWLVDYERVHRANLKRAYAEAEGRLGLLLPTREIVLVAKADRIDELKDGTLAIIDYKTGYVPTQKQVDAGLSPQLPLEAAIAERGGFADVPKAITARLVYLRLTGGEEAGKETVLEIENLAQSSYDNLVRLLMQYEDEATPYLSRPRPMFEARFGDYDHLARVKEWSTSGGGGE